MYKRSMIFAVLAFAVLAFGTTPLFAQYASISGVIMLDKDGAQTPAAGVLVEVFRTDMNAAGPKAQTDKNGRFAFAGLQLGGTYILAFSGPGMSPSYLPGVKPGAEGIKITLSPGDGRQLTQAEVRALASGAGAAGELSAEEKKKIAEQEAKIEEIKAKNKKIEESTAVIQRSLQEGNAAFEQKNYDLAIAKYDEGINADPDFVGSAPVMLNNKGTALRMRAINSYNAAIKLTDAKAKSEALMAVQKDFADSLEAFSRSYTLLKSAQPGAIPEANLKEQTNRALDGANATLKITAQTERVDGTKMDMAKELLDAYAATQPDAAKKAGVKIVLGDLYRVSGDSDNAILIYKDVLTGDPENVDAMAGAGISLVNAGYMTGNKAQLQEGADMLQKYSEAAPAGHKYIDDAKGLIEVLKAEQNINPQRTTPGRTTRRRNN